jgi:hypothetical protein
MQSQQEEHPTAGEWAMEQYKAILQQQHHDDPVSSVFEKFMVGMNNGPPKQRHDQSEMNVPKAPDW